MGSAYVFDGILRYFQHIRNYQYMHDIQSIILRNEIKLKSNINVSENLHPKDNVNYVLRKPISIKLCREKKVKGIIMPI